MKAKINTDLPEDVPAWELEYFDTGHGREFALMMKEKRERRRFLSHKFSKKKVNVLAAAILLEPYIQGPGIRVHLDPDLLP